MALAVGANQDLEIGSGDIGGAFLIPDLDEELYIWLDPDMMTGLDHRVCAKLNKTLYGLKLFAHMFNIKFAKHLISKGFVQSCHDPCLFRFSRGKSFTIVTLHVDDFIYMSPTVWEQNAFKLMMKEGFEVVTFHDEIIRESIHHQLHLFFPRRTNSNRTDLRESLFYHIPKCRHY